MVVVTGRLGVLDGDGATPLALLPVSLLLLLLGVSNASPLLLLPGFCNVEEEGDVLVVITGSDGALVFDDAELEGECDSTFVFKSGTTSEPLELGVKSVGLGHDTSNLEAEVPQCEVHLKYRVAPGAAASSLLEKVWE